MASSSDKAVVGYHRVENTETVSSPLTYANCADASKIPSTVRPDCPVVSNVCVRSAMIGLPPGVTPGRGVKSEKENEEEEGRGTKAFPTSTRNVQMLSFDLGGISPPIANLFRRLITTEVPTAAFDRVLISENDSVVLDELLAHRLGLVPIVAPVEEMEYITEANEASFASPDPRRMLIFELEAEGARDAATTPVYSSQLRWVPLSGQEKWKGEPGGAGDRVFLVHGDILLTKLGPRQKLKLKVAAIKGLGAVHTKWSPVSTCYYEMETSVTLTEPVTGAAAEALVRCCPEVFGLDGTQARVIKAHKSILSRECLRADVYPEFADKIRIEKDKTKVRFHIESVGQLSPEDILRTALKLFAARARYLANLIQQTEVVEVDASSRANAF